jgi:ATP-binding cassette, subfamily B (MDR/TAP), member 1
MGAEVTLQDVSFKYPTRDAPIFRHLNVHIESGQFVAFVGPSGCGKTTIISLLERFYDASAGTVLVNQQDIRTSELSSYRRQLSLVAQDPQLFEGTIRENLTLGLEGDVSDEKLHQACKDAEIHDFIVSLPDGYETALGVNAQASLSGGQKQRVCIARALLRSPSLLLLDEATSSLDSQSEKLVQGALERLAGQRRLTIIAVAHRLATIQKADVIFVFSESQIGRGSYLVEHGTHQDLVRRRGTYWQMVKRASSSISVLDLRFWTNGSSIVPSPSSGSMTTRRSISTNSTQMPLTILLLVYWQMVCHFSSHPTFEGYFRYV